MKNCCVERFILQYSPHAQTHKHIHIVLFFTDSNKTLNQAPAKLKPIQIYLFTLYLILIFSIIQSVICHLRYTL